MQLRYDSREHRYDASILRGTVTQAVLIADDDDLFCGSVSINLRDAGYKTFLAHDGHSAVTLARAERPHLILLDVVMPGLNGFAALNAMRAEPLLNRTPVIMLTARRQPDDVLRARGLGVVDYVAKPIDMPKLLQRVRKALSQAPAAERPLEWLD
jgi:DNA-binding response OmpR family regulator